MPAEALVDAVRALLHPNHHLMQGAHDWEYQKQDGFPLRSCSYRAFLLRPSDDKHSQATKVHGLSSPCAEGFNGTSCLEGNYAMMSIKTGLPLKLMVDALAQSAKTGEIVLEHSAKRQVPGKSVKLPTAVYSHLDTREPLTAIVECVSPSPTPFRVAICYAQAEDVGQVQQRSSCARVSLSISVLAQISRRGSPLADAW